MTDLVKQPKLTAYNVDGLELFFTENRKVRASQRAMSRMANISEATVRRFLEACGENSTILDVVQAQVRSGGGTVRASLHSSSTIKMLLKKYNPERLEQFLEFGIDEGLAQMAGVPLVVEQVPVQLTKMSDMFLMAAEICAENEKREDFYSTKPGLKGVDTIAKSGVVLPERMSIRQMAEHLGISLMPHQSRAIGFYMMGISQGNDGVKPPRQKDSYKNANGNYQQSMSIFHSVQYLPQFKAACEAHGLIVNPA